jgi:hypothetical protein
LMARYIRRGWYAWDIVVSSEISSKIVPKMRLQRRFCASLTNPWHDLTMLCTWRICVYKIDCAGHGGSCQQYLWGESRIYYSVGHQLSSLSIATNTVRTTSVLPGRAEQLLDGEKSST